MYGKSTPLQRIQISSAYIYELIHMEVSTAYHARFVAANDNGVTRGTDTVFTTLDAHKLPDVLSVDIDSITSTSVQLRARCNPNSSHSSNRIPLGPAIGYYLTNHDTPDRDLGSGNDDIWLSETVNGLVSSMMYHFYAEAYSSIPLVGDIGTISSEGHWVDKHLLEGDSGS